MDLVQKTHGRFFTQLGAQQTDKLAEGLVAEGKKGVKSGEGHYKWPAEKVKEVCGRRDAELLRRLKADPPPNGQPITSKL